MNESGWYNICPCKATLEVVKLNMFPSSFIFCICTRSLFSSHDQLGSWEKSVTTGHLYVPYKLFISKCSLIKTRFIIWTIETFCWRQGRDRRADIDTGRPGYYHHQCQVSGNFNFLQMGRCAGGIIMPNCASQIWLLWRREIQQLPTIIQTASVSVA